MTAPNEADDVLHEVDEARFDRSMLSTDDIQTLRAYNALVRVLRDVEADSRILPHSDVAIAQRDVVALCRAAIRAAREEKIT